MSPAAHDRLTGVSRTTYPCPSGKFPWCELINEDWPRRVFAKVLKRAGLPWHTPYDLRHTFATLHLAKGHPITYVSAQLGHSDPSTTLRWYAHWLPSSDKRFADALDSPGQRRRTKS